MARFSANLGMLWNTLPLPEAISKARQAGFEAVECHFPYEISPDLVVEALQLNGLKMLALNTGLGDMSKGEFGVCALPGREAEAKNVIRQAVAYAKSVDAGRVHVMAGKAEGAKARSTFLANLEFAASEAEVAGIGLLIEPINQRDAPGYFLQTIDQAAEILGDLGRANVQLMFDCYHVQIAQGDLSRRLEKYLPLIGHVQIAGVPDRAEPDRGEVDFRHIASWLDTLGYHGFIGAEYRPRGAVEDGLGWLSDLRASSR